MKFLCILSAIFVLLLTAKPCCADTDCGKKAPVSNNIATNHPDTKDSDCRGCSPFACSSCAGFVVVKSAGYTLLVLPGMPVAHQSCYRPPYTEDVAQAIWQPPQLS